MRKFLLPFVLSVILVSFVVGAESNTGLDDVQLQIAINDIDSNLSAPDDEQHPDSGLELIRD